MLEGAGEGCDGLDIRAGQQGFQARAEQIGWQVELSGIMRCQLLVRFDDASQLEFGAVARAGDEAVGVVVRQAHNGIGYGGLGLLGPAKAYAHPKEHRSDAYSHNSNTML